jgi:hypothetical protein
MSISPVSLSYSMLQSSSGSSRRQDFTQLGNALQSGNLQGAQQAFSSLEQLQGGQSSSSSSGSTSSASSGPGTTGTGGPANPIANDFAALGQALSSGDLTQAQSAFSQLQTDVQAAKQSGFSSATTQAQGHHHNHRGGWDDAAQPPSSPSAGSTTPGSTTSGSVNLLG